MLVALVCAVDAVEHEGRGRFSLDEGDRFPRQRGGRGWWREARGRRESRLDRLAAMDDGAPAQFQRFATRLDRVSQERLPRAQERRRPAASRPPGEAWT